MSYQSEVENEKKFIPNIVVFFMGKYWSIRQPDSGLTVDHPGLLDQVTINPTKIDPTKANTTINTYSFKLVDKNLAVTTLFNGNVKYFTSQTVKIWVGRSGVGMPFSDYMPLPDTYISGTSKAINAYVFASKEAKDRLNRPAFDTKSKLEVDILAATTTIDITESIAKFSTSGLFKLDDEFISYSGLDLVNNRFTGCVRGEQGSTPADHKGGANIYQVVEVVGNPIEILLQCLISSGGGGVYDLLPDGAGIDEALINVARFIAIRDEFFVGQVYSLLFYNVESIQVFLEEQILFPNDLRIVTDNTSKVSLAILNRQIFSVDIPVINSDTITNKDGPDYDVDDTKIINVVTIQYDYEPSTDTYLSILTQEDASSISDFGKRKPVTINLKGVYSSDDGEQIVTDIAQRFLGRFSNPRPEIGFTTQMDKSLVNLADKVELVSEHIPNDMGELAFADTVEVLERGINFKTGDVKFKVGFTSFTGIRQCFLAPSDLVISWIGARKIEVGAGRGTLYQVGWVMRIFNDVLKDYDTLQTNIIKEIVGDVIEFEEDWSSSLLAQESSEDDLVTQEDDFGIIIEDVRDGFYRLMFADYDEVNDNQKRYCFVSNMGLPFADGRRSYQITL